MVLLGLSILIASVSFLCYRHPPTSWACFQWLRPSINNGATKQIDASSVPILPVKSLLVADQEEKARSVPTPGQDNIPPPFITKANPPTPPASSSSNAAKAELDRKAMPPPPPPVKKQLPRRNPIPIPQAPPPLPTFTVAVENGPRDGQAEEDEDEDGDPPAPSFPAINSAQRASGGVSGPPRLDAHYNTYPQPGQGLMASPPPLPNRGPPGRQSLSSSLAPPPTHTSIPAKPRRKVLLTPGHSPLDWARLSSSPTVNLRGLPADAPFIRVPPSLLKQYTGRKGKDAWTVLGGKVYNITPYVPYHPGGGPELLKAAGRDGTKLFGEVHPWVNWEGMLEPCLVGISVEEGDWRAEGMLEGMD